jgi:hypothetical protein
MFEIDGWPESSWPVIAEITTQPEMSVPALVMNCFVPLITHSPLSRSARVRPPRASEPASGSVSPNEASSLPLQRSGSHSSFSSSLPNAWIG